MYKLNRITRSQKMSAEKPGKPSRPYESLGIQVPEHGENWINGFGNKDNAYWKEGDLVDITITKKEFNGKEYLNFEMPKSVNRPAPASDSKLEQIINNQVKHGLALATIEELLMRLNKTESVASNYPVEELNEDVPF